MSTLTKLVNEVRKNTELPDYLKLSVGKKRFTKEQLADHLVKLHKTKFFNGNAIKKFKTTPTTPQEKKEMAKRKKEDKKKLPPITDEEIKNLPAPPKELIDKPKKKINFIVVKKTGNPWIAHVKKYAKENNMKYNEALEFAGKTYTKKVKK